MNKVEEAESKERMEEAKRSVFDEFLIKEYDNIAQAHFKTAEMVSEFVRHYLTVASIPLTIIVLLVTLLGSVHVSLPGWVSAAESALAVLLLVISVVGFMFFWYILNLRGDALLYARTINSIRKYFYDGNRRIESSMKYRFRVLPQSPAQPPYLDVGFSAPLASTFVVLNFVYFYIGVTALQISTGIVDAFVRPLTWLSSAVYIGLHVFIFLFHAERRETSYLRSNTMGVDIDGVLNLQKEHFCAYLGRKTGKSLEPTSIVHIPVHEIPGTSIRLEDELSVFNDPLYSVNLPPAPGAGEAMSRIKKSSQLQLHVFTSRAWPSNVLDKSLGAKWRLVAEAFDAKYKRSTATGAKSPDFPHGWKLLFPYRWRRVRSLLHRRTPIERITETWLKAHNIPFDALMVESGSEEVADPAAHVHNRFYASRIKFMKYFVEDDALKASKLAFICDVVFIIDQPYNRHAHLPANVIRVKDWQEILEQVREFS